ncbi:MAG: hypothetical protein AB9873_12200 [Syntrophobacteraceae bacterium]
MADQDGYLGSYDHGVPTDWDEETINREDPPTFESQAAYLRRLGLLTPVELRWLAKHPEALQPEPVPGVEDRWTSGAGSCRIRKRGLGQWLSETALQDQNGGSRPRSGKAAFR